MFAVQTGFRQPNTGRGEVTASSTGTVLTASASTNTKGSWVDLGAVTTYELHHVIITAQVGTAGAAEFCFDIGVNAGGTYYAIAEDLRLPGNGGARTGGISISVPLHVSTGTQLAARCQASVGSRTMEVALAGFPNGWAGAPGASRIMALFSPSGSRGVVVTPTSANTKTSYQTIIASSNEAFRGLFFIVGPGEETGRAGNNTYLMDIGTEEVNRYDILKNVPLCYSAASDLISPAVIGPIWFPTGVGNTDISVRVQASDVTVGARSIDVAAYGLAPY